ncbi:TIGR04500 family putative peptide maturation system protein [Steroidobacter cummioxidans]|uniref:TIGR04500 family putative peptide maturation system protein n=1 Tax=Steroidobacter cummioxidans TaxID=1803913 RepID=UPI00137B7525|nr:TIGR04500 family putative peptide maturation system protein [Steroidobacter cummioxidans]
MLETHHSVVTDVLSCLEGIAKEGVAPSQAHGRVNAVRSRHPAASIELIWDDQAFDGSRHYDALIRPPGFQGTVSLSVCHDDALPWPLRGLQPWRDSELLRVNGIVMPVENAIRHLDLLWQRKPLMRRLIDSCLIEAELERRQIEVDEAEVQTAVNDLRRRRGLLTAADTHAWLAESGMSMQGLTDLAGRLARAAKLREIVVGEDVERYLESHCDEFDVINTRVLQTPDARAARQLTDAVREGSRSFLHVAEDAVFSDSSGRTQFFYRKELRHRLAARMPEDSLSFSAGDLFGPLDEGDECLVIDVVSVEPAMGNPHLRGAVVTRLFESWLREQRQKARIEWFWGPNRATQAAR